MHQAPCLRILQTLIHFNLTIILKVGEVIMQYIIKTRTPLRVKGVLWIITQNSSCKPDCPEQNQNMSFMTLHSWGNWSSQREAICQGHELRQVEKLPRTGALEASLYTSLLHVQSQSKATVLLSSSKSSSNLNISYQWRLKQNLRCQFKEKQKLEKKASVSLNTIRANDLLPQSQSNLSVWGGILCKRLSNDWHSFCWDNGASMNVSLIQWRYSSNITSSNGSWRNAFSRKCSVIYNWIFLKYLNNLFGSTWYTLKTERTKKCQG